MSYAFSASRRAEVTKQRSKYGQRGPMRASGVVVTSRHSGASSASHSTSGGSAGALRAVGAVAGAAAERPVEHRAQRRVEIGARRELGELAPARVVRDALEHD